MPITNMDWLYIIVTAAIALFLIMVLIFSIRCEKRLAEEREREKLSLPMCRYEADDLGGIPPDPYFLAFLHATRDSIILDMETIVAAKELHDAHESQIVNEDDR